MTYINHCNKRHQQHFSSVTGKLYGMKFDDLTRFGFLAEISPTSTSRRHDLLVLSATKRSAVKRKKETFWTSGLSETVQQLQKLFGIHDSFVMRLFHVALPSEEVT